LVYVPTPEQQTKLKELDAKIATAELHLEKEFRKEITSSQRAWEQTLDETTIELGAVDQSDGLVAYYAPASDAERRFDGKRYVNGGTQDRLGPKNILTLAAWVEPAAPSGPIVTRTPLNTPRGTGYQLLLQDGKVQLHLVTVRWKDESIQVETDPLPPG